VRLAGSGLTYEGRLEVMYDGVWGTVCGDLITNTTATLFCYHLGFGYVSGLFVLTTFSSQINVYRFRCVTERWALYVYWSPR